MKWFRDLFKEGRRGLYFFEAEGGGLLNKGANYNGVLEVEELDQHHGLSKIRIIKISGAPNQVKDRVPEWVNTSDIKWISEVES